MKLPIRVRLTAAFAFTLAIVMVAVGVVVYRQVRESTDRSIDVELSSRARTFLATPTVRSRLETDLLGLSDERFGEVLDAHGRVVVHSEQLTARSLPVRATGWSTTRVRTRSEVRRVRILAVRSGSRTVIVATALDDRDDALRHLRSLLWSGGTTAFFVACALAWMLAGAALRPVERLRRAAASHSASDLGGRLDEPAADDEIHRLAVTLNEMLARIERSVDRERSFLDRASHELRTPLANLSLGLELARERGGTPEELRAAIEDASLEAARLDALASNLLALARAAHHELPILRQDSDVTMLLADTIASFGPRATAQQLTIDLDAEPGLHARLDPMRVRQAVSNLIDNACHASSPGGAIGVAARRREGWLEVSVTDDGPGIPTGFAVEPAGRLHRQPRRSTHGGAGLGLAIVAAIVDAHGGSATIEADDGGGTTVRLLLPDDDQGAAIDSRAVAGLDDLHEDQSLRRARQ
jgi:signal transduction histidine kinase